MLMIWQGLSQVSPLTTLNRKNTAAAAGVFFGLAVAYVASGSGWGRAEIALRLEGVRAMQSRHASHR